MTTDAQVLVISRDELLLQTRKLILGAICNVEAVGRVSEARMLLAHRNFDLLVLCYSLSDQEYVAMIDMANCKIPPPKILNVHASGNRSSNRQAGQESIVDSGPYHLLQKAADMLGYQLKGSGRVNRG